MHELSIAADVIAIATSRASGARVRKIVVEVGRLSAVMPEALRFCFDLASAGTLAEGAQLEIIAPMGRGKCRACGSEVELARPADPCTCGSRDVEWLSGEELRVREMELA